MADNPLEPLVALIAIATLPAGILAAMFAGEGVAAAVLVVGWLLLVPATAVIGEEVLGGEDEQRDPLEELRERYARGEIDDAEFERRLDRLIETEDAEAESAREVERE